MTKQKPVCRVCGSDEITIDGPCQWDVESQQWELTGDVYHKSEYCAECDGETRAEWVPAGEGETSK